MNNLLKELHFERMSRLRDAENMTDKCFVETSNNDQVKVTMGQTSNKKRARKSNSSPTPFRLPFVTDNQLQFVLNRIRNEAPCWNVFKTRSGAKRYVDAWSYKDLETVVPPLYQWMENIIMLMFVQAQQSINEEEGEMVPIQMYLCYYPDGSYSCPAHKHDCRQLTLSVGAPRILQVDGRECKMNSGDAIMLHKHRHSVPKQSALSSSGGGRLSLNLFFTTTSESLLANVNEQKNPKKKTRL